MRSDARTKGAAPDGAKTDRALVLRIQRMSTEDGPGIRSTVFFKGCPLSCRWCHNPESISPGIQVHWVANRCIGCRECIAACPEGALKALDTGIVVDRLTCKSCLSCTRVCPSTALEAYGSYSGLDELFREVLKDRVYFEQSGGGVTLSGGEPTLQAGFARSFLEKLCSAGIHTALDTCGQAPWDVLEGLLPYVDLVLYDIKEIDPNRHREFTGVTNGRILENASMLASYMRRHTRPSAMWVRTPIIPGFTARPENIAGIGAFIASRLGTVVQRWELCAFNNLCINKYEGLGVAWPLKTTPLMTSGEVDSLARTARCSGVDARIVHTSGPLRLEDPFREGAGKRPALSVVRGGGIP
ncbi:MAG TPA: glycyl-radical enzyme activating protein [Deltaproteobacteria bacterium]|nr:glycyl-radical enzyme activating protein [Deltaproteobacteria bacterium]